MFWVSIANLVLTVILTGLAIFLTYWWSSYRRILPLELAKRHYKDVVKKGLCPKCGSKKIKFNPIKRKWILIFLKYQERIFFK